MKNLTKKQKQILSSCKDVEIEDICDALEAMKSDMKNNFEMLYRLEVVLRNNFVKNEPNSN